MINPNIYFSYIKNNSFIYSLSLYTYSPYHHHEESKASTLSPHVPLYTYIYKYIYTYTYTYTYLFIFENLYLQSLYIRSHISPFTSSSSLPNLCYYLSFLCYIYTYKRYFVVHPPWKWMKIRSKDRVLATVVSTDQKIYS